MEVVYIANFDYECELADFSAVKVRNNINERFEWIALWGIEDAALATSVSYSKDYLEYIASLKALPKLVANAKGNHFWWGSLQNLELEKKLNSKFFAAQLSKDLFNFPYVILHKNDVLEDGMVAKLDYSVSGRGVVTSTESKDFSRCLFKEPFYQRTCDIGSRYTKVDGKWKLLHRSLNFIDANFNFRGAKLSRPFRSELDLELHDLDQMTILSYLEQHFQIQSIQMDSYLYEENGVIKHKPLGEFNFRRTMIDVAYHILQLLGKSEAYFILRAIKPLADNEWKKLCDVCSRNETILLSPPRARDIGLLFFDQAKKDYILNLLSHKFFKES